MEWLIFGLISLIVGAAQSATQRHYNKKDAQELYEQQLADQREDRQTEFQMESPVALAQQMKQAGQNPAAAFGTGGSVNHVATTAPFTPTSFDPTSAFAGAAQTAFQAKQMKMMETSQELTNEKTRAETFNIWQDGIRKQIENGVLPDQLQTMIDNLKEDMAKKKVDRQLAEMQIAFLEDAKAKGINPVEDEHNESVARQNVSKAQADYLAAQNATEKQRLQTEYANTVAAYASARLTEQRISNEANQEQRNQALHDVQLEIEKYARDVGASEAEIAKIRAEVERRWNSPAWRDVGKMALDFIHHNLNLGGSVGISKTYK